MANHTNTKRFGLIGKNISYSFSRAYFTEKFKWLKLAHFEYVNFDIDNIQDFPKLLKENKPILCGMNVTIPYKEKIFQFLDKVDEKAAAIGAVNTIKITKKGKLKGYNTDEYGFRKSLEPLLQKHHKKALILGTGGAAKAVAYALQSLGISYQYVSRSEQYLQYHQMDAEIIENHFLIINTTPLGTFPHTEIAPNIPYKAIGTKHLCYDLIYNPTETLFLQKAKKQGAQIKNGYEMLKWQAEAAWTIWNN